MKSSAARIIRESEREERPLPKPRGWDPLSGMIPTPDDLPPHWTGGWVGKRLVEALVIHSRMPGMAGPGWGKRSAWPAFPYSWEDALGWENWRKEALAEWERIRPGATSVEVSRMEEAISWPMSFLKEHPAELRCLMLWALASSSTRMVIAQELRKRGWSRPTFDRRRRDGAERIARALNAYGVTVR